MIFESPVKGRTPWFMANVDHGRRLETLEPDVRTHVKNLLEDGFTVIRNSFSREECAELIEKFKDFARKNSDKFSKYLDADGHYPRIANLHAAFTDLLKLFEQNTIAYKVQQAMFDATPSLYTSLFYERGSAQDIHRDTPYFSTKPEMYYLGVWVALEDANEQNGALNVMRGGHKIPEPDRTAIALANYPSLAEVPSSSAELWSDFQAEVQRLCAQAGIEKEQVCVNAGDTVIWHPQLPHGGGAIQDFSKTRFSFVMHTTPLGVPVYHHDKFFNPQAPAELDSGRPYKQFGNSRYLQHNDVDFAHVELFPIESFAR
ncbi:phytanoyl-CoA dioxygenase family protein [Pseudomonas sp. microsymbiont 2]